MENSNQKASSLPPSLNSSPVHLIYLVEQVITDDSEDDDSSKFDGDSFLCNGDSQYFHSNGISPQLGNLYPQEQTHSTQLHNPLLSMPPYSTSSDASSWLNNIGKLSISILVPLFFFRGLQGTIPTCRKFILLFMFLFCFKELCRMQRLDSSCRADPLILYSLYTNLES